jgi:hypothetical protein
MPYRLPHFATTLNYITDGNYKPSPVSWLAPGGFNELGSQNSSSASPCGCRKHRLPVHILDRVSGHGTKEYYFSYHVRRNKCTVFKKPGRPARCASSPDFSERGARDEPSDRSLWAIDSRFAPLRTFHHPGWQVFLKHRTLIRGRRASSARSSVNKSGLAVASLPLNFPTDFTARWVNS